MKFCEKGEFCLWQQQMHMYSYDSEFQHYLTTNLYVFYEAANSYDLTILCDLSKPQWQVGLGAGLGVGHSYKLGKNLIWPKPYEFVRVKSYEFTQISHLVKYIQILWDRAVNSRELTLEDFKFAQMRKTTNTVVS